MRIATSILAVILIAGLVGINPLMADVSIVMKSSISGIPFLNEIEMYQTMYTRPGHLCSITEVEMKIADTNVVSKSKVHFDIANSQFEYCSWEEEKCNQVTMAELESLLTTDLKEKITDSINLYLDSIKKYISFDNFDMKFTNNKKIISGYNCREVLFDMEGMFSMPLKQLPGDIKVIVDGTSWVTDDFENYAEYRQVMDDFKDKLFAPQIKNFVDDLMDVFGIDDSWMENYFEMLKYIQVQNAVNLTLEIWNEKMTVPSMSFNLRLNTVLIDLSTEKIPAEVFETPPGFSSEGVNFQDMLKESF